MAHPLQIITSVGSVSNAEYPAFFQATFDAVRGKYLIICALSYNPPYQPPYK
jgi:hypothetical protein